MSFLCANSISEFDEKFFLLMKYFGVIDLLTSPRAEQICNLNIFGKRKFIGSLSGEKVINYSLLCPLGCPKIDERHTIFPSLYPIIRYRTLRLRIMRQWGMWGLQQQFVLCCDCNLSGFKTDLWSNSLSV